MNKRSVWILLRLYLFMIMIGILLIHMNQIKNESIQMYTAKQYQGDQAQRYTHISCYWEVGLESFSMEQAKSNIIEELKRVYGEPPPFAMAWGSKKVGTALNGVHSATVEIYQVTDDFFMIYPFSPIQGSWRSIKNNSAILNEKAAWNLFGSVNCVGLEFEMNGQVFYVQAVCDMSNSTSQLFLTNPSNEITYCELIVPEMWNGFAESIVASISPISSGEIKNNTTRLSNRALWDGMIKTVEGAQNERLIDYPIWEREFNQTLQKLYIQTMILTMLVIHLLGVIAKLGVIIIRVYTERKQINLVRN